MYKFNTGNVIKTPYNDVVIVTNCNDDTVSWIPIDSSNCSGISKLKDHKRNEACFCIEGNDGEYDEDCENCKGKGSYDVDVPGYEKSKVLASNVKEYILKGLTKGFEGLRWWN